MKEKWTLTDVLFSMLFVILFLLFLPVLLTYGLAWVIVVIGLFVIFLLLPMPLEYIRYRRSPYCLQHGGKYHIGIETDDFYTVCNVVSRSGLSFDMKFDDRSAYLDFGNEIWVFVYILKLEYDVVERAWKGLELKHREDGAVPLDTLFWRERKKWSLLEDKPLRLVIRYAYIPEKAHVLAEIDPSLIAYHRTRDLQAIVQTIIGEKHQPIV